MALQKKVSSPVTFCERFSEKIKINCDPQFVEDQYSNVHISFLNT